MSDESLRLALAVVAALFVLLVVLRGVLPLVLVRGDRRAARARMSKAVSAGTDSSKPVRERVSALIDAAELAIGDAARPANAARYAEWAHGMDPTSPRAIAILEKTMLRARRPHALERLLWKSLDAAGEAVAVSPALEALCRLYEGPLGRPERARALRALPQSRVSEATNAS